MCDGDTDKSSDSVMKLSGYEVNRVQQLTFVIMVMKLQIFINVAE
jgi:hypothetical protein